MIAAPPAGRRPTPPAARPPHEAPRPAGRWQQDVPQRSPAGAVCGAGGGDAAWRLRRTRRARPVSVERNSAMTTANFIEASRTRVGMRAFAHTLLIPAGLGLALTSSGAAGLINQVVWQRALKVFLGGSETISSMI